MAHQHQTDPACAIAHGHASAEVAGRTLLAVFSSPVAGFLLRYGADLGYRGLLLEPDADRAADLDVAAVAEVPQDIGADTDVVVTDHHRSELGPVLRDLLGHPVRWIGMMGSPRHQGPHVQALTELGVRPEQIARIHRPVGLNIGSQSPAEIAVATLAGLLADRNGRPGGFDF